MSEDLALYGPNATWVFRDPVGHQVLQNQRIWLEWDVEDGAFYAQNWVPAEISALELFERWRREVVGGSGAAALFWTVCAESGWGRRRDIARYPFAVQHHLVAGRSFGELFTVPVSEQTGETIRWERVSVADKRWRAGRVDSSGFVQEALGWSPHPLQPVFDFEGRGTRPEPSDRWPTP